MKPKIASLAILLFALTLNSAWGYDNGPINGTTDAWDINFGYIVSDSFVADSFTTGFSFGIWEFPGDRLISVDWSITSGENSGTVYGQGTASGANLKDSFISSNQYGYDIDLIAVTATANTISGTTYWLNLQNASVPSGDPVYWDENSGGGIPPCVNCQAFKCHGTGCPSKASENAIGTIPSEAFTIAGGCRGAGSGCTLAPGETPEPGSVLLFGSGVVGVVGVLRRKLNL